jgi:hypothetical protein
LHRFFLPVLACGFLLAENGELPQGLQEPLSVLKQDLQDVASQVSALESVLQEQLRSGHPDPHLIRRLHECRLRSRALCRSWRECAAPC